MISTIKEEVRRREEEREREESGEEKGRREAKNEEGRIPFRALLCLLWILLVSYSVGPSRNVPVVYFRKGERGKVKEESDESEEGVRRGEKRGGGDYDC